MKTIRKFGFSTLLFAAGVAGLGSAAFYVTPSSAQFTGDVTSQANSLIQQEQALRSMCNSAACFASSVPKVGAIAPGQQFLQNGINQIGVGILTNIFFNALSGPSAADQAAAAQRQAEQAALARAQAAERTRVLNAKRDSLLSQMQGLESHGQWSASLPLMGVSTTAQSTGLQLMDSNSSGLQLMKSDDLYPGQTVVDLGGGASRQMDAAADTVTQIKATVAPPPQTPLTSGETPGIDISKNVNPIPRLGDPEHLAKGNAIFPSVSERAPECQLLDQKIAENKGVSIAASLASDVYDLDGTPPPGMRFRTVKINDDKFERISDDMEQMRDWFPTATDSTIQELLNSDQSAYRAAIYKNGRTGKIYLVFRGTQSLADWEKGNVPNSLGHRTEYYDKAMAFAKIVKHVAHLQNLDLEIVGHSLGGGMADAAGLANQVRTTSFNPEGVNPELLPPNTDMSSADRYITDYVVEGNPLTLSHDPLNFAQDTKAIVSSVALTPDVQLAAHVIKLPRAIGQRVALPYVGGSDLLSHIDPIDAHHMGSVTRSISQQTDALAADYSAHSCSSSILPQVAQKSLH